MLEAALGYPGTAPYVAFYWIPAGDELVWNDGWSSADGEWQGWLTFTRHPRVAPVLAPYHFGDSDTAPTHWLLLDRVRRTCSVGLATAVHRALRTGNPAPAAAPWPWPTSEASLLALPEASWQALVECFQEARVTITPEEVSQQLAAHTRLLAALTAWLDTQVG
jgi:hypothetical protein